MPRKKVPAKPAKVVKKKAPVKKPAAKKKPVVKAPDWMKAPAKIKKVVRKKPAKKVPTAPGWMKGKGENTAPYTDAETAVLMKARKANPKLGQEELATKLFTKFDTIGKGLVNRTRVSIYSALRRLDTKLAKGTTAPQPAASRKAAGKGKPKAGAKSDGEDGGTKKGQGKKPTEKKVPAPKKAPAEKKPAAPKKAKAIAQVHDPLHNTVAEIEVKPADPGPQPPPGGGTLDVTEHHTFTPFDANNVGTIGRLDGEAPLNPAVGEYTDPNEDGGRDPGAEGREAFDSGWDETKNPYQPATEASAKWNDGYAAAKSGTEAGAEDTADPAEDESATFIADPVTEADEKAAYESEGQEAHETAPSDAEAMARESGELADDEEFKG